MIASSPAVASLDFSAMSDDELTAARRALSERVTRLAATNVALKRDGVSESKRADVCMDQHNTQLRLKAATDECLRRGLNRFGTVDHMARVADAVESIEDLLSALVRLLESRASRKPKGKS